MRLLNIAFAAFLLVVATSCNKTPPSEVEQSISVVGKWVIIAPLSRTGRSDVRPVPRTLHFSGDGVFRSWCRVSGKDMGSSGKYTVELAKSNSVNIAVRITTGINHLSNFKLTDVKRGNVEGRDDQGNMKLYEDILTFTDHDGRKRAYKRE